MTLTDICTPKYFYAFTGLKDVWRICDVSMVIFMKNSEIFFGGKTNMSDFHK